MKETGLMFGLGFLALCFAAGMLGFDLQLVMPWVMCTLIGGVIGDLCANGDEPLVTDLAVFAAGVVFILLAVAQKDMALGKVSLAIVGIAVGLPIGRLSHEATTA